MPVRALCLVLACLMLAAGPDVTGQTDESALRREIDALNAAMVSAFRQNPASVATFYGDRAAIIGGGQRHQGREAIDAYWMKTSRFSDWALEALETGGPATAPWQYGRSRMVDGNGRPSETFFVGLLRRQAGGDLKWQVEVFTRQWGTTGAEEASRVNDTWLKSVERADVRRLNEIFDDQFVIVSSRVANKAQEIAELVPTPGTGFPFYSEETRTRGFGTLAVTTGVLKWEFNGRRAERNYASIAADQGAGWKVLGQHITPRR